MTVTKSSPGGSGSMTFPGSRAKQGEQFEIDVLFSVPKGIDGFRLLMLGAQPVPVVIAN